MDDKIKIFLDKIAVDNNNYKYFNSAILKQIKIYKKKKKYNIFIDIDDILPLDIYKEVEEKKHILCEEYDININYNIQNIDLNKYLDYFTYILELLKDKLKVIEIYISCLNIENNKLILVVDNKKEEEKLLSVKDDIENFYKNIGYYDNIDIIIRHDNNILEEIKKDIESTVVPVKKSVVENKKIKKVNDDENIIMGSKIKEKYIPIKTILEEDNNIVLEAKVFGIDNFKSQKSGYTIITLKLTDYTDSIYCKIFIKDDASADNISRKIKINSWYKFRGYTKNDVFSKEIVLIARDIELIESKEIIRNDIEDKKRVELHTHTKMSQMDGLIDEVDLVKQAIKWGHRAIAITDHNAVQAFPHVFNEVTKYNKDKEDDKKFKAIYGAELTMVDDDIDIVTRSTKDKLLDIEYVVFDFETTGFNAGGEDSIIEIGAVKIKNGEIIDRFDELINPHKKLTKAITDITHITDEMLKDKDTEINAVKRFIKWFGNSVMVAHNAKFDVSFLEMAYNKYNLGEFTNTVIDTLELSRALDTGYSRHSLSAIVKRYKVEFSEDAHHRADYDAEATALVFWKMLEKLDSNNIETMDKIDTLIDHKDIHKFGNTSHINLLATNKIGIKNLFKIISLANTDYLYKTPRIPRSIIKKYREGLLIGSGCYLSEVFQYAKSKTDDELSNVIRFYDYVEVQPLSAYKHLIQTNEFSNDLQLSQHLEKIIRVVKEAGKIIVATSDAHYINKEDNIYREIIVNQKVPGGGRHPLCKNNIKELPDNHLRTTDEMLEEFSFLDRDLAYEIVVENTNKIADLCEIIEVIIDTGGIPFSPRVKADDGKSYIDCRREVTKLVYEKAEKWYGSPLPENIEERIATELYGDIVFKTIKEEKYDNPYKKLHDLLISGYDEVVKYLKDKLKDDVIDEEKEKIVKKKMGGVIGGGFDPIYLISQRLVKHSNDEGYLVGSRGSVGSSFVATMMGITEVNPLPAHYRCKECKKSIFNDSSNKPLGATYSCGFDLPDLYCPNCNSLMIKDGQDMPFATFLGFNADKVPDIDLNFSDLNQASAHAYTKVLFGENNVYRAGTIGTVADKTAFGFVKAYLEEKDITGIRNAEVERLALGCTGVKRTTGQHPGGIVVVPDYMEVADFTPYQYPADDVGKEWKTTHFDYHSIDQCLLKLDILGHSDPTQLRLIGMQSNTNVLDVPMDDKDTMSIFTSTDVLGVTNEEIMNPTGTLGIPEFGTSFTIKLVEDTRPTTFAELVKISGLSHGTDVWLGNAQELIQKNIVPFKDTIGCRDDIMVYLMYNGVEPIKAFKIMEFVRKGKASVDKEKWEEHVKVMMDAKIPEWFINSCQKIKYMFPKAHAAAYVISAFRIAWYKVHMPVYFYSSWFTSKAVDVDVISMIDGYEAIKRKIEDIQTKGFEATNKENAQLESLKIALEATARGIKFLPIDLYKSEATTWIVNNDNEIYPPFSSIEGLGDTVAKNIVKEREKHKILSIEDIQKRAKISTTLIDKMKKMNILKDLDESNQLSLF